MSAGDAKLVVPCCSSMASDQLIVEQESDEDHLTLTVQDGPNQAYIFLDEAGARALFNWLGVKLHKGGLS